MAATVIFNFGPSNEAQQRDQKRLCQHIRDARAGLYPERITRLCADDMIDLTDPKGK